jgi:sugar phosphate isomerase/epimerase
VFRAAATAGFEGVELNPRWCNFLSWPEADLRSLASEVADAGLVVSGVNLSRCLPVGIPDAAHQHKLIETAIATAPLLGTDVVTLSLSMPTLPTADRPVVRGRDFPSEVHSQAADLIAGFADRAASIDVKLAMELHDDGLLDTPELLLQLVRRVNRPNVGTNPDVGNICRGAGPVADWRGALASLAPTTVNWHVKNYRDGRPSPVWDGVIDYPEAVALMRQAGYRGWVSIESYMSDVFNLQKQSLDYLRPLANTGPSP